MYVWQCISASGHFQRACQSDYVVAQSWHNSQVSTLTPFFSLLHVQSYPSRCAEVSLCAFVCSIYFKNKNH